MLRSRPRPAWKTPNHFLLRSRIADCFYLEWSPLRKMISHFRAVSFECKPKPPRDGTAIAIAMFFKMNGHHEMARCMSSDLSEHKKGPAESQVLSELLIGSPQLLVMWNRKSVKWKVFKAKMLSQNMIKNECCTPNDSEGPPSSMKERLQARPRVRNRGLEEETTSPALMSARSTKKVTHPAWKNARPFYTPIETSPGVKNAQPFSAPIENRQLLLPGMKPSARNNQSLSCCFFWMQTKATTRWHCHCRCHVFQNEWPPRDGTMHEQRSFGAQERPSRKSSPVRTSDRLSSTFGDVEPKVSQMESFQGQDVVPEHDQEWVLYTKWLWGAPFFNERKIAGKTTGPQPWVGRRNDIPSTDERKKREKSCSPGAKKCPTILHSDRDLARRKKCPTIFCSDRESPIAFTWNEALCAKQSVTFVLFLLNANQSHHEMALPLPLPCFSKWMATTRWHDAWAAIFRSTRKAQQKVKSCPNFWSALLDFWWCGTESQSNGKFSRPRYCPRMWSRMSAAHQMTLRGPLLQWKKDCRQDHGSATVGWKKKWHPQHWWAQEARKKSLTRCKKCPTISCSNRDLTRHEKCPTVFCSDRELPIAFT